MRAKIVVILYIIFFPINSYSQREQVWNYQEIDTKTLHFGFLLGINTLDYTLKLNAANIIKDSMIADVKSVHPGFHVGIVSSLRLNDYMELRLLPGMTFAANYFSFLSQKPDYSKELKVEYYPIELPIALKLKSDRINNYRPYLITDFTLRHNMSGYSKKAEDEIRFKHFNMFYSVGFGIDYYFSFFRLSTEIKMSFGILDILNHKPKEGFDEYTEIFDRIRTNLFYLTFHFE